MNEKGCPVTATFFYCCNENNLPTTGIADTTIFIILLNRKECWSNNCPASF